MVSKADALACQAPFARHEKLVIAAPFSVEKDEHERFGLEIAQRFHGFKVVVFLFAQ